MKGISHGDKLTIIHELTADIPYLKCTEMRGFDSGPILITNAPNTALSWNYLPRHCARVMQRAM